MAQHEKIAENADILDRIKDALGFHHFCSKFSKSVMSFVC